LYLILLFFAPERLLSLTPLVSEIAACAEEEKVPLMTSAAIASLLKNEECSFFISANPH
jgi:hypothetical protein